LPHLHNFANPGGELYLMDLIFLALKWQVLLMWVLMVQELLEAGDGFVQALNADVKKVITKF